MGRKGCWMMVWALGCAPTTVDVEAEPTQIPESESGANPAAPEPIDPTDPESVGNPPSEPGSDPVDDPTPAPGEDPVEPVPTGRVPMFMAQGHAGLTLFSCDDGQSWTGLRSFETDGHPSACDESRLRCNGASDGWCGYFAAGSCDTSCNCDHHPGSGKGLAYGDGYFVAAFGWGTPGELWRSADGVEWELVVEGPSYADVAFGERGFVVSSRDPEFSTDGGATWMNGADAPHAPWNVRRLAFLSAHGLYLQTANSNDEADLMLSEDFSAWTAPESLPAECGRGAQSALDSPNVIVVSHGAGYVCRSEDQGASFSMHPVLDAERLMGGLHRFNGAFVTWGHREDGRVARFSSTDGQVWTAEDVDLPNGTQMTEVAHAPQTGTLVAASGGWNSAYERQQWFRSIDAGRSWQVLQEGPETHPIREMAFGYALPNEFCPLP
ncbi:MAG: hypothetical protein AAF658_18150 [Myxococcota bacterium]